MPIITQESYWIVRLPMARRTVSFKRPGYDNHHDTANLTILRTGPFACLADVQKWLNANAEDHNTYEVHEHHEFVEPFNG